VLVSVTDQATQSLSIKAELLRLDECSSQKELFQPRGSSSAKKLVSLSEYIRFLSAKIDPFTRLRIPIETRSSTSATVFLELFFKTEKTGAR